MNRNHGVNRTLRDGISTEDTIFGILPCPFRRSLFLMSGGKLINATYDEPIFGEQKIATYQESKRSHEALIYDASSATGRWAPSDLEAGHRFKKPEPMYRKLDEAVIDEERERLGQPSE